MKKILVLSDSFTGYGAEYMIGWVGSMLAENGYEVIFCSPFDSDKDDRLSDKGKFIGFGLRRNANPLLKIIQYFLLSAWKVCKICKKHNIDTIVTFKENPLCIALLAKLFKGVRHLHSERDDPYNRDTISSRFKMWLYRFCDKLVFQTVGARDFFPENVRLRSSVIPNPVVVPEEQWRLDKSKKIIVCVGRLNVRYKRQDLLINAFSKFIEHHPDWLLMFVGDGKDMNHLKKLAKDLGVDKQVIFEGKVNNVKDYLLQSRIYVLSSDTEGMPNALMEAMALGMPVITTDCSPGGGRYLVNNLVNGILVSKGNMEEIYEALMKISSMGDDVMKMACQARLDMTKLNPSIVSSQWINLINEL